MGSVRFKPIAPLERRTIRTTTLDDIARDQRLRFVDFIKLDTQGSELDILREDRLSSAK